MRAELPPGVRFSHPAALLATWFGVGLLPVAPGTWGSLAALPLAWLVAFYLGPVALAAAALVLFAAGWWAADHIARKGGTGDPSWIVIDEVAGQMLALVPAALDPVLYAIAFMGFRIFDIVKPWPVGWADRKVPGALGVMLDDLLAGLWVAAILFAVRYFVP